MQVTISQRRPKSNEIEATVKAFDGRFTTKTTQPVEDKNILSVESRQNKVQKSAPNNSQSDTQEDLASPNFSPA
jgi:hypothetical protein